MKSTLNINTFESQYFDTTEYFTEYGKNKVRISTCANYSSIYFSLLINNFPKITFLLFKFGYSFVIFPFPDNVCFSKKVLKHSVRISVIKNYQDCISHYSNC